MPRLNLAEGPGEYDRRDHHPNVSSDVTLAFQAIVDLRTGAAAGYEVIAQIAEPEPLHNFWPATVDATPLGAGVEASLWPGAFVTRDGLSPDAFLALNATSDFLASRECEALMSVRGDLEGIVIEVAEHDAFASYDRLSGALSRYRSRGASVAIDAAGAGYTSLSHILALRPEYTKLDRALVSDCDRDPAKAALIEMMNSFAARCGSRLIVEGIETGSELATATRVGVTLAQGNLLARPEPACCLPPEGVDRLLVLSTRGIDT